MEIRRGEPLVPVATPWFTTADIGGTGVGQVLSGSMDIGWSNIPENVSDLALELRCSAQVLSGTGFASVWFILYGLTRTLATAADIGTSEFSRRMIADGTVREMRMIIPGISAANGYHSVLSGFAVRAQGRGTAADTEWAMTGIKVRVIYTPGVM